jgi:Zn-dependent M16 (insulinase) family peptidase
MASRFRKVQSFQLDYSPCKLTQYVSERSGMHVVVVDRQGPKVEGYFGLATEILNDSGAPHTLEHLVFQASEKYPHRGLLDKLASRLFSKTNAWTATDHTAYTLETAGWAAFSQVLPVYLAHVLVPRITEATVTTEVWHVDGEGNDSGVVYSEMQAVEYTASWRTMARLQEIMYPAGSGFRYETGGLPEPLRNLTMEQIVEFHKSMYQPRNLEVIILGEVDHDELLRVLDGFEELIKDSIPPLDSPFKR